LVGVVLEVMPLKTPLSNLGVQVVVVEKVTELEVQVRQVKGLMVEREVKLKTILGVVGEPDNKEIQMEMDGEVMV
jgi:hypothetical protein